MPHEDRLLRLEPALRPTGTAPPPTIAACSRDLARARPRDHLLRARRLRPAEASRHRPAGLGRGASSIRPRTTRYAASSREAARADVVVKASGVGVFDDVLLEGVIAASRPEAIRIFWDVDAPATLAESRTTPSHPLHARSCPSLDLVLTYGGGAAGRGCLRGLRRARAACRSTTRSIRRPIIPCRAEPRFAADLAFLGNRLPDREARVEEFFLERRGAAARARASSSAAPAGRPRPCRRTSARSATSTRATTTPSTRSPLAVLNIARDSMAATGFSPADPRLRGGRRRRLPDHRRLGGHRAVPGARARRSSSPATGATWPTHLRGLTPERAQAIGEAARARILARAHLCPPRRRGRPRSCARRRAQAAKGAAA